jgi:hypothetical protein
LPTDCADRSIDRSRGPHAPPAPARVRLALGRGAWAQLRIGRHSRSSRARGRARSACSSGRSSPHGPGRFCTRERSRVSSAVRNAIARIPRLILRAAASTRKGCREPARLPRPRATGLLEQLSRGVRYGIGLQERQQRAVAFELWASSRPRLLCRLFSERHGDSTMLSLFRLRQSAAFLVHYCSSRLSYSNPRRGSASGNARRVCNPRPALACSASGNASTARGSCHFPYGFLAECQ